MADRFEGRERPIEFKVFVVGLISTSTILAIDVRESGESKPQILTIPFEDKPEYVIGDNTAKNYLTLIGVKALAELKKIRPELDNRYTPVEASIANNSGQLVNSFMWRKIRRNVAQKSTPSNLNSVLSEIQNKEKDVDKVLRSYFGKN